MQPINADIRSANEADIDQIVEMSVRTIRARYPAFLGPDAVEAFIDSGAVDEFVYGTIERASVAVIDEIVVGHAVGTDNHIDLLMVDERLHRQGLGTGLLRRIEDFLFARHEVLELESFRDNQQANTFYRNHGWEVVDSFRDEEYGVERLKMQKSRE